MKLFKLIEVDLAKERKRIRKAGFNKRQRTALTKLVNLFERGEFQKCLDHILDGKAFPYNKREEYDEKEHICEEISNVLHEVGSTNFFTQDQLLQQAIDHLKK